MLAEKLICKGRLTKEEYAELLNNITPGEGKLLREQALLLREKHYGKKVFLRGLIEFTNYCKNNCYYCGIRASNHKVLRYRLTEEEILTCCEEGHRLGFRSFVLQGGEDPYYKDGEIITNLVKEIKKHYPDCALTLSVGEQSYETYKKWRESGADRYLLRHETANEDHYKTLHPKELTLAKRKSCLAMLKELGYQVGAGFMVGSPNQTNEMLGEDLAFLEALEPQMVGIGPFIPHQDTPFGDRAAGSVEKTLLLLSILRIILPKALIPATTALGTLDQEGREKGILAGANVVMPNLSPLYNRKKYELYNDKICTGEEAAEGKKALEKRISSIGYQVVSERGDAI